MIEHTEYHRIEGMNIHIHVLSEGSIFGNFHIKAQDVNLHTEEKEQNLSVSANA